MKRDSPEPDKVWWGWSPAALAETHWPWGQMCESPASSEAAQGERRRRGLFQSRQGRIRDEPTLTVVCGDTGEGSCVLGCPGSHLTSQSGNYSEENSFRVEILLTSAPVAESVCHLSPQFLSFFDILSSVRTFDGCHLSIPVSFGILHKTLNLSAIESK